MIQECLKMHSCDKCAVLNKAVSSEGTGIRLSTLEATGQGEDLCPILAIVYQGVMLFKEKWGYLNEKDLLYGLVDLRITKDGVLEADIRKIWEVVPIRIAMIEFYVLPGKVNHLMSPIIMVEYTGNCLETNRRQDPSHLGRLLGDRAPEVTCLEDPRSLHHLFHI